MRSFLVTAGVILILLAVSATPQGSGANGPGRFSGTYMHRLQVGPGSALPSLLTVHLDGAVTVAAGSMFGAVPNAATRLGPVHGVWEAAGRRTLNSTSLFLVYDAASGLLTGINRSRASLEFTADFSSYEGTEFIENVPCPTPVGCPNPMEPTLQWTPVANMPAGGFTVSGSRLDPVAPGPL